MLLPTFSFLELTGQLNCWLATIVIKFGLLMSDENAVRIDRSKNESIKFADFWYGNKASD